MTARNTTTGQGSYLRHKKLDKGVIDDVSALACSDCDKRDVGKHDSLERKAHAHAAEWGHMVSIWRTTIYRYKPKAE